MTIDKRKPEKKIMLMIFKNRKKNANFSFTQTLVVKWDIFPTFQV